jgi:hypothetical protein
MHLLYVHGLGGPLRAQPEIEAVFLPVGFRVVPNFDALPRQSPGGWKGGCKLSLGFVDEMEASTRAARLGVEARALSVYRLREQCPPGLVLGFGAVNRIAIKEGLERLATALRPANS